MRQLDPHYAFSAPGPPAVSAIVKTSLPLEVIVSATAGYPLIYTVRNRKDRSAAEPRPLVRMLRLVPKTRRVYITSGQVDATNRCSTSRVAAVHSGTHRSPAHAVPTAVAAVRIRPPSRRCGDRRVDRVAYNLRAASPGMLYPATALARQIGAIHGKGAKQLDFVAAIKLYRTGWSMQRLAEHYRCGADTVRKALSDAGVSIRRRRGWKY